MILFQIKHFAREAALALILRQLAFDVMPMMKHDDSTALVQLLARYLRDNPLACDTPEGIARWWLGGGAEDSFDETSIQRALQLMEAHGLVERLTAADGRVRYRRGPAAAILPGTAGGGTETLQ